MTNKEKTPLPQATRWTGAAALAALPLGWLFGMILGSGQDPAGEGMALGIGLALGVLASVFFGLIHWYCRKERRISVFRRHRRKLAVALGVAVAAYAAWYIQPAFEDQRYSVRVKNWSSKDMSNVEVRFSNETITIGDLPAGTEIQLHDFSKKPFGVVQASWVDGAGEARDVADRYGIGTPRRFDGGTLVVRIFSEYQLSAGVLPARVDAFVVE